VLTAFPEKTRLLGAEELIVTGMKNSLMAQVVKIGGNREGIKYCQLLLQWQMLSPVN
jgi:hypothetical protein